MRVFFKSNSSHNNSAGEYPDNRVLLCGDLGVQNPETGAYMRRHFQLSPRELQFFLMEDGSSSTTSGGTADGGAISIANSTGLLLRGRVFVEKATLSVSDDRGANLLFTIKTASGILLHCQADAIDAKQMWIQGIRRQVRGTVHNV